VAVAEIEPFPCRLLQHYYPHVPNLGDVTKITEEIIANLGRIDIVVFGSPCQDLSVAGKRKGLAGARSNLFFTAVDIARWARDWCGCRFALWENVPGAFSSNEGRDFAAVVDALAGLEPGTTEVPKGKKWGTEGAAVGPDGMVEWSTLDAQWFGVAQRRRRVFALADFGAWADRPPILLEPESLRGDSAPSRGTGEDVAPTLTGGANGGGPNGPGRDVDSATSLIPQQRLVLSSTGSVAHCLNAGGMGRIDFETETMVVCATGDVTHTLRADGFDAGEDGTGWGTPIIAFNSNAQVFQMQFDAHTSAALTTSQKSAVAFSCKDYGADAAIDVAPTLRAMGGVVSHDNGGGQLAVAFQSGADCYNGRLTGDVAATLGTQSGDGVSSGPSVLSTMDVRRLTPRECERLQGFPDDYTAIPKAADGPRYKALGNSKAVPVVRWIGKRIDFVMRWF
jgi:DNA (cytosine-5)-methyltransferase 1